MKKIVTLLNNETGSYTYLYHLIDLTTPLFLADRFVLMLRVNPVKPFQPFIHYSLSN